MNNNLLNKYGVLNNQSNKGSDLNNEMRQFENRLTDFIKKHDLTQGEIHQVISVVTTGINAICCESILRKSIEMRKSERQNAAKAVIDQRHLRAPNSIIDFEK